uniref:RepB family plasmid replication initiator protein n=1 Tax=Serratia proteamaculans TaxID=28151 RepID=UPI002112D7E5|nr:RepB family plasmid replication initiator protein [Serratia proteamaculans]
MAFLGQRLYESLCQFRKSGIWITTPNWLAERYQLPQSQRDNFAEMKRTFIKPALDKISKEPPLTASMSETDDGKLIFTIITKNPEPALPNV